MVKEMNRKEALSAALDGELSESELTQLLGQLNDKDLADYAELSVVGDLIRSSDLASVHSSRFTSNFAKLLDAEPTVVAPVLKAQRERSGAGRFGITQLPRVAAGLMAVGFFSFAMYQAVPAVDSGSSTGNGSFASASQNAVSEADLALWQEYFMAHQQNSISFGLSGVSPIARIEADRPQISGEQPVYVTGPGAIQWMNVWEPSAFTSGAAQLSTVSSNR